MAGDEGSISALSHKRNTPGVSNFLYQEAKAQILS
jgi:hypothetical protein